MSERPIDDGRVVPTRRGSIRFPARPAVAVLLLTASACGSGGPGTAAADDQPRVVTITTAPSAGSGADDGGADGEGDDDPEGPDLFGQASEEEARNLALSGFEDAPALVATSQAPTIGNSPVGGGDPGRGPQLPLAYLADPAADARVEESPQQTYAVSPDASVVAVFSPSDALNDDSVNIIATTTGEILDTVAYDTEAESRGVGDIVWSADSRTVVFTDGSESWLHRVGGGTATFDSTYSSGVYASNASGTDYIRCGGYSGEGSKVSVGTEPDSGSFSDFGCSQAVSVPDGAGNVVVVFSDGSRVVRHSPGAEPVEVFDSGEDNPYNSVQLAACDQVAVLNHNAGEGNAPQLHYVATGLTVAVPNWSERSCPVLSTDGALAAYATDSGSVEVVAFGTGAVVEVAKSGTPLGFGTSGTRLLVEANGTFVVNTDGSGGAKASVQVGDSYGNATFCAAARSGLGLLTTADGVVLFDIDADEAVPTDLADLPGTCWVTSDGKWLTAGNLLVDLDARESIVLDPVDPETGGSVEDGYGGLSQFLWHGPATASPAVSAAG